MGTRTPPPAAEAEDDVVLAHPGYARLAWLSVTNPGPRSTGTLRELLTTAHALARTRSERRTEQDG